MADERSVVITLKLQQDKDELNPQNQTGTVGGFGDSARSNAKDNMAKAVYSALVVQALNGVTKEIVGIATYEWEKRLTLTDDYVGQRQKNLALQRINTATNLISSVGSAAAMGSILGPLGALVGGLIGFAVFSADTIRTMVENQEQQDIFIRQLESSLNFTRSRAGYSLKAASIGEDL